MYAPKWVKYISHLIKLRLLLVQMQIRVFTVKANLLKQVVGDYKA